jgi:putative thioredoxin
LVKEPKQLKQDFKDNPTSPAIIEQLCAISLLNDDYENILKYLLDILKIEPAYNNNIVQQGLITIFNLLGQQHPLTRQYRKSIQQIME